MDAAPEPGLPRFEKVPIIYIMSTQRDEAIPLAATDPTVLTPVRARVARPAADLASAAQFYEELVGLSRVTSFAGHDGFDGVVLALGPGIELELVRGPDGFPSPSPTHEDLLVLWLGAAEFQATRKRLAAAGVMVFAHPNPFWAGTGAVAYTDPEGYVLVVAPA